ncbi:MAG: hypothetical protein H7Y22_03960 [Gemmatimonadaceae bacterium]|nr:hypothetical protein [Gloeobacterales cyanobacterium ES-bin-141]
MKGKKHLGYSARLVHPGANRLDGKDSVLKGSRPRLQLEHLRELPPSAPDAFVAQCVEKFWSLRQVHGWSRRIAHLCCRHRLQRPHLKQEGDNNAGEGSADRLAGDRE